MVSLKEVAKLAGVSVATASWVLNKKRTTIPISERTRRRVLEAARKLNYHPDISARGLRMRKTHTVGIITYDSEDPLASAISARLGESLFNEGYRTVVGDVKHSSENASRFISDFISMRVDGIVLLAGSYKVSEAEVERIRDAKIPAVCIGKDFSQFGIQSYTVDNRKGTADLTEYLVSLGYREFAVIVGADVYEPDNVERFEGVKIVCHRYGIGLRDEFVVKESEVGWDPAIGYATMKQILKAGKPEVVVCFDDCTAFGAIRAISESGLSVPEDVGVVGFDDLPISAFYNPPLTTVRQPIEKIVSISIDYLYRLMDDYHIDENVKCERIEPEIVVRSSCKYKKEMI